MKKTNNKGFSLVELIIVVAIMAVLVGVLAPQYIKYLDKSKAGTDRQMLDNLRQAITTTILDPDMTKDDCGAPSAGQAWRTIADGTEASFALDDAKKFWKEVFEIMGVQAEGSDSAGAVLIKQLSYKASSGTPDIEFKIDDKKNVGVRICYTGSYGADSYDFEIE